jgi:hypothetical protein
VNLQTTFTCQCKDGFSGDGLKSCEDLNECLLDRNHCARNTECVNTLGGYSCACMEGYKKLNQFQCEDEDECSAGGSNQCHPKAVCENTKGSYTCTCQEGYSGSGFHCSRKSSSPSSRKLQTDLRSLQLLSSHVQPNL